MSRIERRAERLAERWRRSLACHEIEIARCEIQFDLDAVKRAIAMREKCFPELSLDEHKSLYPILIRMKDTTLNCKRGSNKKVVTFRLSEDARFKLEYLAEKGGVSKTAVLENLIIGAHRFKVEVP